MANYGTRTQCEKAIESAQGWEREGMNRLASESRLSEKAAQGKGSRPALRSGMNNTRYHRFRIERDAPTQEQYGSIVVSIPIGIDDFDKGSILTAEESTVRRCLSIPDGVPFTMLQHPIDPDRRDFIRKRATFFLPGRTRGSG